MRDLVWCVGDLCDLRDHTNNSVHALDIDRRLVSGCGSVLLIMRSSCTHL